MAEQLTSKQRKARLAIKKVSECLLKSVGSRRKFRLLAQNMLELKHIKNGLYLNDKSDLLDYKSISIPKYMYHDEMYYDNTFFGCERVVRNYSGSAKPIKACFEHGIFWGISGNEKEYQSDLPGIITFGPKRAERLAEVSDKKVFPIGPYIYYSPLYQETKLECIKEQLGKILLVFPAHSIQFVKQSYNDGLLIAKIDEMIRTYNFQTVVVSFHPLDIEQGKHEPILQKGWKVFTAGNRYDPLFLSRLKSMLWLSEAVLTNSAGTHIGYAICMNKPIQYFKQEIYTEEVTEGDLERSTTLGNKRAEEDIAELEKLFSTNELKITEDQLTFCDAYFGLSSVKTKQEIAGIVDTLEAEYRN